MQPLWKTAWRVLKKLKFLYDPAIQLLVYIQKRKKHTFENSSLETAVCCQGHLDGWITFLLTLLALSGCQTCYAQEPLFRVVDTIPILMLDKCLVSQGYLKSTKKLPAPLTPLLETWMVDH